MLVTALSTEMESKYLKTFNRILTIFWKPDKTDQVSFGKMIKYKAHILLIIFLLINFVFLKVSIFDR